MKDRFLKRALWTALFVAGGAMAQDAAISGADFTRGLADAQLSAIGSRAATEGKTVVVTAPAYWQAKVASKVRAGAHGKPVAIRFSNGFYENVLVRTEAPAPAQAAAKPEPKSVAKVEAKPAKVATQVEARKVEPKIAKDEPQPQVGAAAEAAPAHVPAPAPQAEPPHVAAAMAMRAPVQQPVAVDPEPAAPRVASNVVAVPQVSRQPVAVPIPTAAINTAPVKPAEASASADASAHQRMLASLNDGRPASGSLTEAQLQSGDQVYSDGGELAVVRLDGLHRSLYWLQGSVDLQRVQFMPQGNGHYDVTGPISPKAPVVHRNDAHNVVASGIPAAGSAARARLEKQFNNGQPITGTLSASRLQPEDRLLVDGGAIVVARREGNSMSRYWLDGSIDLGQTGIQKVDGSVYRVIGNNLH